MSRIKNKLALAILLILSFAGVSAASAVPVAEAPPLKHSVYLYLDGVQGEVRAKGYENWIELSGIRFGASNSYSSGGGTGSVSGKAEIAPFSLTKNWDSSSVALFLAAASGSAFRQARIVYAAPGDSRAQVLTIDLTAVKVASYTNVNEVETIELLFDSVKFTYASMNGKGALNPPIIGGWNVAQNGKLP